MAKNYMEEVAKMLGVELDEEFLIDGRECKYKLSDNGLLSCKNDVWHRSLAIGELLEGNYRIVKLSWEPKLGEHYYAITPCLPKRLAVGEGIWSKDMIGLMELKLGMVFKTEEEAKAALPRVYKELTGKDLEE